MAILERPVYGEREFCEKERKKERLERKKEGRGNKMEPIAILRREQVGILNETKSE